MKRLHPSHIPGTRLSLRARAGGCTQGVPHTLTPHPPTAAGAAAATQLLLGAKARAGCEGGEGTARL